MWIVILEHGIERHCKRGFLRAILEARLERNIKSGSQGVFLEMD